MIETLVILAGGRSTRFGGIGTLIPKSLLPINNTTLLQRQISQSRFSGIDDIIVSTLPEFSSIMQKLLSGVAVEVFANKHHKMSSFTALARVIHEKSFSNTIAVSLADIYFISNPFEEMKAQEKTCLYLSNPFLEGELSLGGIGFVNGNKLERIVAEPLPNNKRGLRWNGLCTLASSHQQVLLNYAKSSYREYPEEDFFAYLLEQEEKITYEKSVDFINNNSQRDLFLSGLYNLSESFSGSNKNKISDTAEMLRKHLYGLSS